MANNREEKSSSPPVVNLRPPQSSSSLLYRRSSSEQNSLLKQVIVKLKLITKKLNFAYNGLDVEWSDSNGKYCLTDLSWFKYTTRSHVMQIMSMPKQMKRRRTTSSHLFSSLHFLLVHHEQSSSLQEFLVSHEVFFFPCSLCNTMLLPDSQMRAT